MNIDNIGWYLRLERQSHHHSQFWAAQKAGVCHKTMRNIEIGKGCLLKNMLAVLRFYGYGLYANGREITYANANCILQARRWQMELTQINAASMIGMSDSCLVDLENRRTEIRWNTFLLCCAAYGIELKVMPL